MLVNAKRRTKQKQCILTIKRLHAAQIHLPAEMLAVDLAHVRDVEGIFFPRAAIGDINASNTFLDDLKDQILGG